MKQLRGQNATDHSANSNKETRWDRIRKRCTATGNGGTFTLKSENVRRFIEIDYIGSKNKKALLGGDESEGKFLNPAMVMDMRHDMFRKIPKQLPLATAAVQRDMPSCRKHNMAVEQRFIDNELKKLRQQLEKQRKRNEIKFTKKQTSIEDMLMVSNEGIMESLTATSAHIEDFYAAPLEAFQTVEELCEYHEEVAVEEKHFENDNLSLDSDNENSEIQNFLKSLEEDESDAKLAALINVQVECRKQNTASNAVEFLNEFKRQTPSPLTSTEEFLKPMREAADKHQVEVRRVHFEDEVLAAANCQQHIEHRPSSSCSNTSDGLDSIISDLAEEALYELQMEEQEKHNGESLHSTQVPINQNEGNHKNENEKQAKETVEIAPAARTTPVTLAVVGESKKDIEKQNAAAAPTPSPSPLLIKPIKIPTRNTAKKGNQKRAGIDNVDTDADDDEDEEETASIHEQNLIIEQLFQSRAQTRIVTMRKYFLKWIHYTTISKIERENMSSKNDRIQKINAFLDKIRKEKARISKARAAQPTQNGNQALESQSDKPQQLKENVQITKKYKCKIKMQQDIIDLQRLKLERQERLIMELKLKKLTDEAKEARQEIKNELKAVIRSGDEKAKAKAKCLQLIGNLRDTEDEDEFKRLRGRALLMPKFLENMQERALERSIRHEQARQRRLQQEAEREAQKIALEEAKRLEDEEAKRMRIEALKEKRRQEKMAKVLKERERQRAIESNRKAQEFNRRRLLKRIGMEAFKRSLERKRDYMRKCEQLRRQIIKRAYFVAWRDYYRFELTRRINKADKLHCVLVKRNALEIWLRYVAEERSKFYVAIDWYDMKLATFMFREWCEHTKRLKVVEEAKTRKAISHFEWNLKFKVLDCWQRLPQILQLEKETEERRQRWRMKIWELLPDYTPRLDSFV